MSFSETLKTRNGIKRFALPTSSGCEVVLAFEYLDKKVEVHQMKVKDYHSKPRYHASAPLNLDENSKVALISCDQIGAYLLSATPLAKPGQHGCLAFKAWDSTNIFGFSPTEIQLDGGERTMPQDGKFRSLLPFLEEQTEQSVFKIDSLGSLVALLIETDILIWKTIKKDTHVLNFQLCHSLKLKANHLGLDLCLLRANVGCSISVLENGSFSLWNFNDSGTLTSKTFSNVQKSTGIMEPPQTCHRLTPSNVVFTDGAGKLWMYSSDSNLLSSIKGPGLATGRAVFAVTCQSKIESALLAVCYDGHTINIYSFDYKAVGISNETIHCQRPIKILFSSVPLDAMVFVREDTLALSSSSNRTLTIWTGIADAICF